MKNAGYHAQLRFDESMSDLDAGKHGDVMLISAAGDVLAKRAEYQHNRNYRAMADNADEMVDAAIAALAKLGGAAKPTEDTSEAGSTEASE